MTCHEFLNKSLTQHCLVPNFASIAIDTLGMHSNDTVGFFFNCHKDIHGGKYTEYIPSLKLRPYIKRFSFTEGLHDYSNIDIKAVGKENVELHIHYGQQGFGIYDADRRSFIGREGYFVGLRHWDQLWLSHMGSSISMMSIEFTISGAKRLLQVHTVDIFNKITDVENVLGSSSKSLVDEIKNTKNHRERIVIVERYFNGILKKYKPDKEDRLMQLCEQGLGKYMIGELCKNVKISGRTLERYFVKQVGLPPKEYQKLIRFNKACELLSWYPKVNIPEVIYKCKYYDQSHFAKEFRRLFSKSPLKYIRQNNGLVYLGRGYVV